jgi:Uma2 family endonuclease
MAMPASPTAITTIEELLALPEDGLRHELLDGVHVVTPAPRLAHQAVLSEFSYALRRGLEGSATLLLLTSPADIVLGPRTLVQPDLFVVRTPADVQRARWQDVGVPIVAIEFLSPTTAARDRGAKRRLYQQAGVAEYWIVDLDARLVERWRPADDRPEIANATLRWNPGAGTEPIVLDLGDLFRRVLGPES